MNIYLTPNIISKLIYKYLLQYLKNELYYLNEINCTERINLLYPLCVFIYVHVFFLLLNDILKEYLLAGFVCYMKIFEQPLLSYVAMWE